MFPFSGGCSFMLFIDEVGYERVYLSLEGYKRYQQKNAKKDPRISYCLGVKNETFILGKMLNCGQGLDCLSRNRLFVRTKHLHLYLLIIGTPQTVFESGLYGQLHIVCFFVGLLCPYPFQDRLLHGKIGFPWNDGYSREPCTLS